ncbi:hypothetical protein [Roseobacter sp. GAI101]|uniref:hypothetical protein n=1 Tax=Roseobacter sp. (strain GAI101) TaxID=391589 RepID=UPI00018718EA|nr:hypothetical protein [Roseobacter sp. GAI101]EEB86197.1 response regulator receiver domain protein, putative [Roseobacter sp. GAI101]
MNGFFVDDNSEERIRISRLLEQEELRIDSNFVPTEPTKLRDAILAQNPDLVALDFRLDDEDLRDEKDLKQNNYKGGALAQILREAVLETPDRDFPIILVSTEENIKQIYSIDKTSHDLFDQKYMKGRLSDKYYRLECQRQILSLAKGYKEIASKEAEGKGLFALLALEPEELEIVPLLGLATDLKNANSVVHVISRLILRQLIERPGPLLAGRDVAARLGLSNNRDQIEHVMSFLFNEGMAYEGVYSDGWLRVWRHRLDDWANEHFHAPLSSIPGSERAAKISELIGLDLEPAISRWSSKSDELFAFACSLCANPTERRNSVALYDKYLLPYAERKRVCFDCLMRGRLDEHPQLSVDESDLDIFADVREGRITRQ